MSLMDVSAVPLNAQVCVTSYRLVILFKKRYDTRIASTYLGTADVVEVLVNEVLCEYVVILYGLRNYIILELRGSDVTHIFIKKDARV